MSRCFPYPSPYYKQSQIESIKLLKDIEKSKKNEEKENKSQKKRKREMAMHKPLKSDPEHSSHRYRTNEEKSHKKRKSEKKSPTVQRQYSQKISKDVTEQLERSGLTEEHELSFSNQYKLNSPESSHDSSKRRKVVPCVSIHETHGTTLRIKLPSLKHKLSVPPSSSQKHMESDVPLLLRPTKPELLPSLRQIKSEKPFPSMSQMKAEHHLALSKQVKLQPPMPLSKQAKLAPPLPSSMRVKLERPLSSSKQVNLEPPLLSSSKQVISEIPLPSSKQDKSELLVPLVGHGRNSHTLAVHSIKNAVNEQPASDEQACSSGRGVEATVGQEASLARHRASSSKRSSRKDRKNQQLVDLTVNWKTLTLQVNCSDINDEWLLKAPEREIRSGIECRASGEGLTCKINDTSSLQPRACYLPEFDTYQLPYVVPY